MPRYQHVVNRNVQIRSQITSSNFEELLKWLRNNLCNKMLLSLQIYKDFEQKIIQSLNENRDDSEMSVSAEFDCDLRQVRVQFLTTHKCPKTLHSWPNWCITHQFHIICASQRGTCGVAVWSALSYISRAAQYCWSTGMLYSAAWLSFSADNTVQQ